MKKIIFKSQLLFILIFLFSLLVVVFPATPLQAQIDFKFQIPIPGLEGEMPVGEKEGDKMKSDLLAKYIEGIYNYSFMIAGILAAVMLMAGGVIWLISAGNKSTISKAKTMITSSLVGLVILLLSYFILDTINPELLKKRDISIDMMKEPVKNTTVGCCECDFTRHEILLGLPVSEQFTCYSGVEIGSQEDCQALCLKYANEKFKNIIFDITTLYVYSVPKYIPDNSCITSTDEKISRCGYATDFIDYNKQFNYVGWNLAPGVKIENLALNEVSSNLAQLLNCMRDNLPGGVGTILTLEPQSIKLADVDNFENFEDALEKCDSSAIIIKTSDYIEIRSSDDSL